jgi:hypothetical protein
MERVAGSQTIRGASRVTRASLARRSVAHLALLVCSLLVIGCGGTSAAGPLADPPGRPATGEELSDDSLMTLVQERTFRYFWDGAEPVYLGLDPRGLRDRYADDYWELNGAHTLINRQWCIDSPNG